MKKKNFLKVVCSIGLSAVMAMTPAMSYSVMFADLASEMEESGKGEPVSYINDFEMSGTELIRYVGKGGHVEIPDCVETIADNAFSNNLDITSVEIPDSVIYIDWNAFSGCANLEKVTMADSVAFLGSGLFAGCSKLSDIKFSNNLSVDGWFDKDIMCDTLWYKNKKENREMIICGNVLLDAVDCEGEVIIPEGISAIGGSAFYNNDKITSVKFPSTMKSVQYAAFYDCDLLTNVEFNEGLESLNTMSFGNCKLLKDVKIPSSVTELTYDTFSQTPYLDNLVNNSTDGLLITNDILWYAQKAKGDVVIPSNVKEIEAMCFYDNDDVISITIPESVQKFGGAEFSDCSNLKTIIFEGYAYGLDDYQKLAGIPEDTVIKCKKGSMVEAYCIKNDVKYETIGALTEQFDESAHGNVVNEGTLVNSSNYTKGIQYKKYSDGWLYLYGAGDTGSLSNFYEDKTITGVYIENGINSFSNLFYGCSNIKKVILPVSVSLNYSYYSFSGCSGIEEVVLPGYMSRISGSAFENCTSLKKINLPQNLEKIGSYAFIGCEALENITLPEGLEKIESAAFRNCKSLKEIKIPDSVEEIGYEAFSDCTELENIEMSDHIKTMKKAFNGTKWINENKIFIYNGVLVDGTELSGKVVIPDGVTEIGACAFANNEKIIEIEMPDSVKKLGNGVFMDCRNLSAVTLSNSLKSIKYSTFSDCYSLNTLVIPDSVTYIEEYVGFNTAATLYGIAGGSAECFANKYKNVHFLDKSKARCESGNLTYAVIFDEGVGQEVAVITGCKNVKTLEIPATIDGYKVASIEKNCFDGCNDIEEIDCKAELVRLYCESKSYDYYVSNNAPMVSFNGMTNLKKLILTENHGIKTLDLSGTSIIDFSTLNLDKNVKNLYLNDMKNLDFRSLGDTKLSLENVTLKNSTFSEEYTASLGKTEEIIAGLYYNGKWVSFPSINQKPIISSVRWNYECRIEYDDNMVSCTNNYSGMNVIPRRKGTTTAYYVLNNEDTEIKLPITINIEGWDIDPALDKEEGIDLDLIANKTDAAYLTDANSDLWEVVCNYYDPSSRKIDSNVKKYVASEVYAKVYKAQHSAFLRYNASMEGYQYSPELYFDNNDSLHLNGNKVLDEAQKADAFYALTKDGKLVNHYDDCMLIAEDVADFATNYTLYPCANMYMSDMYILKKDGSLMYIPFANECTPGEMVKVDEGVSELIAATENDEYVNNTKEITYLKKNGEYRAIDRSTTALIADNVKKVLAYNVVVKNDNTTWGLCDYDFVGRKYIDDLYNTQYVYNERAIIKLFDTPMKDVVITKTTSSSTTYLFIDDNNTVWTVEKTSETVEDSGWSGGYYTKYTYSGKKVCENSKGLLAWGGYLDGEGNIGTEVVSKDDNVFIDKDNTLYIKGTAIITHVKDVKILLGTRCVIVRSDNSVWYYTPAADDSALTRIYLGPKGLLGDVNGDNTVDLTDTLIVLKAALGLIDESEYDKSIADYNGDSTVDLSDALLVLKVALGIMS